jgi:hypothetical protein
MRCTVWGRPFPTSEFVTAAQPKTALLRKQRLEAVAPVRPQDFLDHCLAFAAPVTSRPTVSPGPMRRGLGSNFHADLGPDQVIVIHR